jgi:hypothetical protein
VHAMIDAFAGWQFPTAAGSAARAMNKDGRDG